jgi:hypothetical protein
MTSKQDAGLPMKRRAARPSLEAWRCMRDAMKHDERINLAEAAGVVIIRRTPDQVGLALMQVQTRCQLAQIGDQESFFWQQVAIQEVLGRELSPLGMLLAEAVGALWMCGLIERLPETEAELLQLAGRLRQAAMAEVGHA